MEFTRSACGSVKMFPARTSALFTLKGCAAKAKKIDDVYDEAKLPSFMSDADGDQGELGREGEANAVKEVSGDLNNA